MKNGWTGGQYSVVRMTFGAYLAVHFAMLLPWAAELYSSAGLLPDASSSPLAFAFPNILAWVDPPWLVVSLLGIGVISSFLFAFGWGDRVAAIVLWYLLAIQVGRNPLILNPSLPFVGWLLLWHAAIPASPYLSLKARGRIDPAGDWRLPPSLFTALWVVMSIGYSYSGWTKLVSPSWVDGTALARVLENPLARPTFIRDLMLAIPDSLLAVATWGALGLELLFAPLALVRRVRPFIWLAMLSMHLGLVVLIDFADLSFGMVIVHLFAFNPDWVRPGNGERETIYYDGSCGLCHRAVRFVLAEDQSGEGFTYAPLGGVTFEGRVTVEARRALPDSIVLQREDGAILVRSRAALHIMSRLGGWWRVIAVALYAVPRPVADLLYEFVASVRSRLFAKPTDACPILPKALRDRFLA